MILCDYADAPPNVGKLFVSGGGWNRVLANAPALVALGIIVNVPWDQTNRPHPLLLELVDEDGHRVQLGNPPQDIAQQGQFEAGRPAGAPAGEPIPLPMAFRRPVLPLPVGGYSWVLSIDGDEEARVSFRAVESL